MKNVSSLEFRHFSTTAPDAEDRALNERAFALWEDVWIDTFNDLDVKGKKVHSDDYLHKELVGLFDAEGHPAGFMLYQFCDLRLQPFHKLAYFDNYPRDLYESIVATRDQLMLISYMTIDPEWRKSQTDHPISELLMGFAILRLMESSADKLFGYFRNNRGTHNIFYRHGGRAVRKNERAYNVDVDFAYVTKSTGHLSTLSPCAELTRNHWIKFKKSRGGNPDEALARIRKNERTRENHGRDALGEPGVL